MKYLLIVIKLPIFSSAAADFICISIRWTLLSIFYQTLGHDLANVDSPFIRRYYVRFKKLFANMTCLCWSTRIDCTRKVAKDNQRDRFTKQKPYLKSRWRHLLECKPKKSNTKKDIPNLEHPPYINLSKQSFVNYLLFFSPFTFLTYHYDFILKLSILYSF